MKKSDLKTLNPAELAVRIAETDKEYTTVREAVLSGREKNHTKLPALRRTIARLQTFLHQSYERE